MSKKTKLVILSLSKAFESLTIRIEPDESDSDPPTPKEDKPKPKPKRREGKVIRCSAIAPSTGERCKITTNSGWHRTSILETGKCNIHKNAPSHEWD